MLSELLRLGRFESVIHDKGVRLHPLSAGLVNSRYRICLVCRLIGGFFMAVKAIQCAFFELPRRVCVAVQGSDHSQWREKR